MFPAHNAPVLNGSNDAQTSEGFTLRTSQWSSLVIEGIATPERKPAPDASPSREPSGLYRIVTSAS